MKSSTVAVIIVGVLIAVGVIAYVLSADTDDTNLQAVPVTSPSQTDAQPTNSSESSQPESMEVISAEEVALHNVASDCWTIIDGIVYDITSYVPRHPGGDEILRACGSDGTSLFNQRTTDDGQRVGSGTPHSTSASAQLADFMVGTLE